MSDNVTQIDVEYDPFTDEHQLSQVVPSTEPQKEIWTTIQMSEKASCAFNESITLEFDGQIQHDALSSALQYIIQRHDALRTTFSPDGSNLYISESTDFSLAETNGDEKEFRNAVRLEADTVFDLEKGPLIRFRLISSGSNRSWLIISAHHIICDGWSLAILVNDLSLAYNAAVEKRDTGQSSVYPYSQYAREYSELGEQSGDREFWTNLYSGVLPTFDLPTEFDRPAFRTFEADRLDYELHPELIADVKKMAARNGVSLTSLMLSAFYICLYKWSGEQDLVVGLPAASQPHFDSETLVGHCVNFLPLRSKLDPGQSFHALLLQVSNLILDAYEHQNYTYGTLLKKLPIERDPSRIPLCPASFNVDQGIQGSKLNFQDLEVKFHSNPRTYENFEIFINASDYGDRFIIECQYNSNIFSDLSIQKRLDEYRQVLIQVIEDPQYKLSEIQLLSPQQCSELLTRHASTVDFGEFNSLPELIDIQVNKSPDAIAIIGDDNQLTYNDLNSRSNQLAAVLIEHGLSKDNLVGICLDRSAELLVVLLGVLKTGAGYVPLDPEYPVDRLNFMVKDSGLQYLITQDDYINRLSSVEHTLLIDKLVYDSADKPLQNPQVEISEDSICYVIYTSGSTGKPKGVMVPHSSVSNFLRSMTSTPGISNTDTMLAVTTLSFDIAVLELYLPLVSGAKVVVATREEVIDANKLKSLLDEFKVTIMQATPTTWRLLCNANWLGGDEFKILCGGEALPSDLCADLLERCGQLWNMYGPPETTIWSTCHLITKGENKPFIGSAIANTNLYVLDEFLNLVPDGIAGELYIGGNGVTLGYMNRESLTNERFLLPDMVNKDRCYRTGDKVRFTSSGNLEYLGRLDAQIKLRGFRIELGEIESSINQHESVKECAVTAQEKSLGDERLVGFIVPSDKSVNLKQIRESLSDVLPNFMIPQHLMQVSALPRTANGKLDRKALPNFVFSEKDQEIRVEASTASERILVSIWREVLNLNSVSIDRNFFHLGGHSLLIAKIIQKLERDQSVLLHYRDVFDNPTIQKLAQVIDSRVKQQNHKLVKPITPGDKKNIKVLSLAQQRLWYLDKMDPGSTHFNLPSAFRFLGKLDIAALELAFQQIISRQEVFRTSILDQPEGPVLFIYEQLDFTLEVNELPASDNQEELLSDKLDQLQCNAFDISQAPLLRAELIKLSEQENVLFFMPHHLVFDGWSFDVFLRELTTFYSQNTGFDFHPLPELPIQYADYAIWLRELLSSHELDRQLKYWREQLQGSLPVLQMPIDYSRPEVATNKGAEIHFQVDESVFESLESLAKSKDVSIFMILMSCYLSLLNRYTGQTDLIVGVPMADRTRPGTEDLIGFFVNAMVLRFNVDPDQSFTELLNQVKETCLSGFSNQDVPFESLVEQLNPERDLSRAPLFQTSVTYQDVSSREISMGDIDIQQIEIPTTEAPLDINIWFKRRGNEVLGAVVYNTDLFHADSIERIVDSFQHILLSVSKSWHQPISHIELSSEHAIKTLTALNNNTDKQWEPSASIQELYERQAAATPGNIAVICETEEITYRELSDQSNQFAHYLIQQGVRPGDMIGLCVDRSVNMLVVLLGVLKVGCSYVPLDPEFPQERLAFMVTDAGLEWLITQNQFASILPLVSRTLLIDNLRQLLENMPVENVDQQMDQEALAFVIYTSGSTGNPKGVMVQHSAVTNFLQSMAKVPGLDSQDKLLAVTTLSFDIAVLELYLPLIVGATTVIASKQDVTDGRRLLDMIRNLDITVLQATPYTWRMLIAAGWDDQCQVKALCGGEALAPDLAAQLFTRTSALWNMYGPTETTVWSTCSLVQDPNLPVSIGTPIANTRIYILDERLHPTPQGVAGELYIGGSGVTKGYLGNAELTCERFLENSVDSQGLLYRTGDKVRYRVDGSLEYLGRVDQQVKVRGFRIELGEVETVLRRHDKISDCVVTVIEERVGEARMVAYLVLEGAQALTITELRDYCRTWLPVYMIPQHLIEIAAIPRTPNGKIDRKKLPRNFTSSFQQDVYVAPETEEQKWLADVWEILIGIEKVGKLDNFFELGGHSLLSMQVIHKIERVSGVSINPRELLMGTLEQVASKFNLSKQQERNVNTSKKGFLGRLLRR